MAFLRILFIAFAFTSLLAIFSFPVSLSAPSSIHELLRSRGLPAGLVPKEVKSYTLSEDGLLEVLLDKPCLTKYENRVLFDSVVRANLSYGSLVGVKGLSQEELFLWLPVKDIIVFDPRSGVILFDIGVAHKQFSVSIFEDPPSCKPQGTEKLYEVSISVVSDQSVSNGSHCLTNKKQNGSLRNHLRKENGYEALR